MSLYVRFVMRGIPAPHNARQGLRKLRRVWTAIARVILFSSPPCPMTSLRPCSQKHVVSSWGFFRRAFFFLCSFSFFCPSRLSSLPSSGWAGVVSWLLFLAAAFVLPFFFWVCCLVRFFFSFPCCCLCFRGFSSRRLCGVGSSWLVFCLWFRLVRLCACGALSCFRWGFVPLFFGDRRVQKNIMPSQFFISVSPQILPLIQISKSIKLHI